MLLALCGYTHQAGAQLYAGAGFEYGLPIVAGRQTFVKTAPVGFAADVGCLVPHSRLFPSFTYLLKEIRLPVANNTYSNLSDQATSNVYALNMNYKPIGNDDNYTALYLGIGVAKINPDRNLDDNTGNALSLRDTGSNDLYPLAQLGIQYRHRILPNSNFFLCLEANVRYISFRNNNRYYLGYGSNSASVPATINGSIYFPSVFIHLDYVFGRRES